MKNLSIRRNDEFEFGPFGGFGPFGSIFRPFLDGGVEARADLKVAGENYVLEMDLPGLDKKDISVFLKDGYLNITASKNEQAESGGNDKYIRRERRCGSVSRSFYVGDLEEDKISAAYVNGVLTVTFPKERPEKDGKKKINID